MKKSAVFFFMVLFACIGKAQKAKDIAETLLQHYEELANGSYVQMNKARISGGDSITQFKVAEIIGANVTTFTAYEDQLEYELTYFRNNPLCVKTAKELVKALKIIARNNGYTLTTTGEDSYTLFKGATEIMHYSHEVYMDIYPNEYLHFHIYHPTPFSHYLANEAAYHEHLPIRATISREPQAVLLYDSLKKRSIVKNGIFKNGRLKKGSFRISGYDKFFDGTWLSRAWNYDGISQAVFVPEGTTDSIIGFIDFLNFSTFDASYTLYFNTSLKVPRIADDAAPWLKNVYEPVYLNRKALRQKEYHDAHLLDNTVSLEQAIRNSDANRNNETQSQGGSKNSSTTSQQSTGRDRPCSTCGGKGRVMITDRYGNSASGFCSACNGTGVIHN